MQIAKAWIEMAQESLKSGITLVDRGAYRSAMNRLYFAAYQSATAMLIHSGKIKPPRDREGWSHDQTPDLVRQHLRRVSHNKSDWSEMSSRLRQMRKSRESADYYSRRSVSDVSVRKAERWAGQIIKVGKKMIGIDDG